MTEADLPAVLAIERACFPDPWTEGIFRSSLSDPLGLWLIAEEEGILLGYAGMQSVVDEGYIDNVAVDPAARRRGVGSLLLRGLEAEAQRRELSFLSLEVRVGNAGAIALYSAFGFDRIGCRPGYYLDPKEDALIMTKYYRNQVENP